MHAPALGALAVLAAGVGSAAMTIGGRFLSLMTRAARTRRGHVLLIAAYLLAATALFYAIPAPPDAPAAGDAGHLDRAALTAAVTGIVGYVMIRFVVLSGDRRR